MTDIIIHPKNLNCKPVSGIVEIPLSQNKFSIIDEEDFHLVSKYCWRYRTRDNSAATGDGKNGQRPFLFMHRIIVSCPKGMMVDHIDRNQLNNTRSNLRVCTNAQNQWNTVSNKRSKHSVHKGIFMESGKYWRARITCHRKVIHLGLFKTEIEAAIAYNEAALKYHGEFARLNNV